MSQFEVSTHSRPKAAGYPEKSAEIGEEGFNSQPPEGGWVMQLEFEPVPEEVSTHSRPKAAG